MNDINVRALLQRSVFATALRLGRTLLVIPLFSPAELGVFRYYLAATAYVSFFHGGSLQAFSLRFAEAAGRGDQEECDRLQAVSFRAVVVGTFPAFGYVLWVVWQQQIGTALSRPILAVWAACGLVSIFMQSSYRVRRQFRQLAANGLVSDAVGFIFLVVGAVCWGLNGALLLGGAAVLVSLWMGREWLRRPAPVNLPWSYVRSSFAFGSVLMMSALVNQTLFSADVLLLGHVLPVNAPSLGLYAFGASIAGLIYGLVGTVAEVQSQELLFRFGIGGRATKQGMGHMVDFMARESLIAVWISCAIAVCVAVVVPLVLKRYGSSLQLMGPILAAGVILRWKTYPMVLLNAESRLGLSILAPLAGVLGLAVHIWVVHRYWADSLRGFSFCVLTGYTLSTAAAFAAAYGSSGAVGEGLHQARRMVLANAPLGLYLPLGGVPQARLPLALAVTGLLVGGLCCLTYRRWLPGSVSAAVRILVPERWVQMVRVRFSAGR